MQVNKQYLFPTVFYEVKDVLPKDTFDSVRQHIVESYKSNPADNWQSESSLHEMDEFKLLTDKIIKMGKFIFDDLKFVYDDFEITEMWANVCGFPSTENTMLLFPSWLQHYVPKNVGSERRTSISFNLMLRGMVGRKGSLQSAKF